MDPKAPQFLTDLGRDLHDRRLLPLIALIVVAIVAVPFALGRHGSAAPPPSAGAAVATASSTRPHFTVISADPGLRSYQKRLRGLPANDPFKQKFTAPQLAGSGLPAPPGGPSTSVGTSSSTSTSGSGSATGTTVPTPTGVPVPSGSSTSTTTTGTSTGGGSNGGNSASGVTTKYLSYEIDVKVVRNGKRQILNGVPVMTPLPGAKSPVALFMGVSSDGKKALLLISNDVQSVFGDAKCALGSASCQLILVEPGLPETFSFGPDGAQYRINVLKINQVFKRKP
jgi:hypothetical protein